MKKIFAFILIVVFAACSMSPAPTQEELAKIHASPIEVQQDTEIIAEIIPVALEIQVEPQDTTKKEKKEAELKKLETDYQATQKNVMKQIDKLEEQQQVLDSLIKEKKK